jgi:hypothetical protein
MAAALSNPIYKRKFNTNLSRGDYKYRGAVLIVSDGRREESLIGS